jgi:hypothetical protein
VAPRTAPEVEAKVLAAYEAGERAHDIAARLGLAVGTIYNVLQRHRWPPTRTWRAWRHRSCYGEVG